MELTVPLELEDAQIAEATSNAAMKMVLARERRAAQKKDDRIADFVTDACATVAIAYHRAAGVYTIDKEMQESRRHPEATINMLLFLLDRQDVVAAAKRLRAGYGLRVVK